MQKSLNSPITLKVQQPKPEYLGFQTIVNQAVWPIAVIKFNGTDAYRWDWMSGGPGHLLLYVDFGSRNVGSFGKYKESHISYHESGRHQSRVTGKSQTLYLSRREGTPVAQIPQWKSIASVPAPLTTPLPHKLKIPEWKRATNKITLIPENLAGRQDIYLRVYLCNKDFVHVLVVLSCDLGAWLWEYSRRNRCQPSNVNLLGFAKPSAGPSTASEPIWAFVTLQCAHHKKIFPWRPYLEYTLI